MADIETEVTVGKKLDARKKFEEKIINQVDQKISDMTANVESPITANINAVSERFEVNLAYSIQGITALIQGLKNNDTPKKHSKDVIWAFGSKPKPKNTGYDKRGALKDPNNEGQIDPNLVARNEGESRIDWIIRLFLDIGFEGQAYKDITNYVIKTVKEDS